MNLNIEAKNRETIIYSKDPLVRDIGEMKVDVYGTCDLRLKQPDAFDFDSFIDYIKNSSIEPKPGILFRTLERILPDELSRELLKFHRDAWSVNEDVDENESYCMRFPRNKQHRISITKRDFSVGTDEEIIFWDVLLGFLGQKNIADIHRHSGPIRDETEPYRITLWDRKYVPDFIDLLFGDK